MTDINWSGEILDTIASLAGKYGRWLSANAKRSCFIVWSLCTIYWSIRDFSLGLYSQTFFCIFSVGLNIYGYFNWKRKKIGENDKDLTVVTSST